MHCDQMKLMHVNIDVNNALPLTVLGEVTFKSNALQCCVTP